MITTFKSLKWHPFLIAHKNYRKYDHEPFFYLSFPAGHKMISFTVRSILSVCAVETSSFHITLVFSWIVDQGWLPNYLWWHKSSSWNFTEHIENWLFEQWMWKQPFAVGHHCTHIILHNEVQTFKYCNKKKKTQFGLEGEPLSYTFLAFQEIIIVRLFHHRVKENLTETIN